MSCQWWLWRLLTESGMLLKLTHLMLIPVQLELTTGALGASLTQEVTHLGSSRSAIGLLKVLAVQDSSEFGLAPSIGAGKMTKVAIMTLSSPTASACRMVVHGC
jgi:hypothetical protein